MERFSKGEIEFSRGLKRFWVFMPNPETYEALNLTDSQASVQLVKKSIQDWKKFFEILRERVPKSDLKLGLFKEPPFFGASFIDWNRPGGRIHVSPYIWNVAAPNCPGYDMLWVGNRPSAIYETYLEGLNYLQRTTVNELRRE